MNYQNFNQSNGFPLETENLEGLQKSFRIFNYLGNIAGNFTIISGCEITSGVVSDGIVQINNETFDFRGGIATDKVVIIEEITQKEFEDGSNKDVFYTRYVTFGIGATMFNWADFKRPKTTKELTEDKAEKTDLNALIARIAALEARPISTIPIGTICIWNRPANQIPVGWEEVVDMRGKMPIGLDPDYNQTLYNDLVNYNLQNLNATSGKREHKLTIDEMPAHNHSQGSESLYNNYGGGSYVGSRSWAGDGYSAYSGQNTSTSGGDKAHTNMPPYRVVHFIKYVG